MLMLRARLLRIRVTLLTHRMNIAELIGNLQCMCRADGVRGAGNHVVRLVDEHVHVDWRSLLRSLTFRNPYAAEPRRTLPW